ncbi:MAG: aminoglycoside phosphotransferase family protein [Planctomycetota bacterium]
MGETPENRDLAGKVSGQVVGQGLHATGSPFDGGCDGRSLAAGLEPTLRKTLEAEHGAELGKIEWFKAAWQRSGSATGFAELLCPTGRVIEVAIKLPVQPREHRWTTGLGTVDLAAWESAEARALPVPRVFAGGTELGGYDLAWVVMEKFHGGTAREKFDKQEVEGLLEAAADFQAMARGHKPVDEPCESRDWAGLIEKSRASLRDTDVPQPQKWNATLKRVQKLLPRLTELWCGRPCTCWCHGDLHPGNAMRRDPHPEKGEPGRLVLIDLGLVHPGHWVEDAVYVERQFWGSKDGLKGIKPVPTMSRARKRNGLTTAGDHMTLANVRRVLMAACVPAYAAVEGTRAYTESALELLDRLLPTVSSV